MGEKTYLIFFVNGKKILEENPDPEVTLLQYLRQNLRLTGSKNACDQGGCGACTVMLSKYEEANSKIRHFTVNACITLLCSIHGYAVTTVEGVGNTCNGLHPIQQSLVESHGIQCGFCTPGMVMTLFCLWRNKKQPTPLQVERVLEGNLCRCTGYRPIMDAMKQFYVCPMKDQCCKNKLEYFPLVTENRPESLKFAPNDPTQDIIFPPSLMVNKTPRFEFKNEHWSWVKPLHLEEVLDIKRKNPDAVIIMGGTSLSYLIKSGKLKSGLIIDCNDIPEMNIFNDTPDGIHIGAAVTMSEMEEYLISLLMNTIGNNQVIRALLKCVRFLAADQIRNRATIGGHIVAAHPSSDLNPLLLAAGAELQVISSNGGVHSVSITEKFFTGAYRTSLRKEDIVVSIYIPFLTTNHHFDFFKQSPRTGFSYATVNAAICISVQDNTIESLKLCFGGVCDRTYVASKCMEAAIGLELNETCIEIVLDALTKDILEANKTVEKYNLTLAANFVFKFLNDFIQQDKMNVGGSLTNEHTDIACDSMQFYEDVPEDQNHHDAVGRPIPNLSAKDLVCGEAKYIDDLPRYENELFLCPVLSTKAHAKIINVDPSAALDTEGVIEYIDHCSVIGSNIWGVMQKDEELFATRKVHTFGQLIGGVIATSKAVATKAARLVKVEYEDLKPILTIEEAIESNSFFELEKKIYEEGNVEEGFKSSDHVIKGSVKTGAQEHFYLEPLSAIAVPRIEQNEMEVFVGHQNSTLHQKAVAQFLGVSANKVTIRHRRTGGAFGGKETQAIRVCGPAAIAAARTRRPVRCILDRWQDFQNTGKRHPYLVDYEAGFTDEGNLLSVRFKLYSNAGFSIDLSKEVVENSIRGIINCYKIPNVRVEPYLCRTNTTSNTAFRGFGVPQALVAMETLIEEVADAVGKKSDMVRQMNFLKEGDTRFLDMPLTNCNIMRCWSECKENSKYEENFMKVDQFNKRSKWRKRGISLMPLAFAIGYPESFLNQGSALIHIFLDGSVSLTHGGCEIGQGINTKMIQVASRALGVPIDMIHTCEHSTATVANATATSASTTSDKIGAAVYNGCKELLERLQPFREKNPNATWTELVNFAYLDRVSLSVVGFGRPLLTDKGWPFCYFTYGTSCSVVEIDSLTGEHQILSTHIVMDVGKSLNPAIDIGQIEGGFLQGYGMLTLEEIKMTKAGELLCNGPINYKIPGVRNVPRVFQVSLLKDCPNTKAVYSSKGIGEPPFLLAISVFLAIREAIKVARNEFGIVDNFVLNCPATPARIRMACEDDISRKSNNPNEKKFIFY